MHKTMFDTFLVKDILRMIAIVFLKVTRWKVIGQLPTQQKYVMIAAPHTSNWDLPFMLAVALALRGQLYWMGKEQIFSMPFKHLMMWCGGIPVKRSQSTNMVTHTAEVIKNSEKIVIVVPPEGTRSKVKYWKTGFYHIARLAEVPIVLGFLDYAKRQGGIGPQIIPSGNLEQDMLIIKQFYATITGKKPTEYHD